MVYIRQADTTTLFTEHGMAKNVRHLVDEAWDAAALKEDVERMEARKRKEEHRQTYTKRIIAHPQFKNIGYVIRLSA
mgnify:CR=1 FL=1